MTVVAPTTYHVQPPASDKDRIGPIGYSFHHNRCVQQKNNCRLLARLGLLARLAESEPLCSTVGQSSESETNRTEEVGPDSGALTFGTKTAMRKVKSRPGSAQLRMRLRPLAGALSTWHKGTLSVRGVWDPLDKPEAGEPSDTDSKRKSSSGSRDAWPARWPGAAQGPPAGCQAPRKAACQAPRKGPTHANQNAGRD